MGVYFPSDSKTLQLLDETTGPIRTVAPLEGHSVYAAIAVSPDSAYLVFNERLWRADLKLVEGLR